MANPSVAVLSSTSGRKTTTSGVLYDADRNLSIPYELINDSNYAAKMSFTRCCQFSQQFIFGRCVFLVDSRDGFLNASNFSTHNGKRLQRYSLTNSYRSFKIHGFTHRTLRGDLCRRYIPCDNSGDSGILDISLFGELIKKPTSKVTSGKKTISLSSHTLVNRLSIITTNRLERNCIMNRSKYYHPFLFLHFAQNEYNYSIFNDCFDFIYRYIEENDYLVSLAEQNVPKIISISHSNDMNGFILSTEFNETRLKFLRLQALPVGNCENYEDYSNLRIDPLSDWISVTHYDDNRVDLFHLYENEPFYSEIVGVHGANHHKLVHDNEIYVRCVTFLHYLLWRRNYEDYLNLIPHLLTNFDRRRVARVIPQLEALDDEINRILVAAKSSSIFRCSSKLGSVSLRKVDRSRKKRSRVRQRSFFGTSRKLERQRYPKRAYGHFNLPHSCGKLTREKDRPKIVDYEREIRNDRTNTCASTSNNYDGASTLNNHDGANQPSTKTNEIQVSSSTFQTQTQLHEQHQQYEQLEQREQHEQYAEPNHRISGLYFYPTEAEISRDETHYRWYVYENGARNTTTTETPYSKVLEEYCLFNSDFAATQFCNDNNTRDQEIRALEKEIATLKRDLSTQSQDIFPLTQSMTCASLTRDIMDFSSPLITAVPSVNSASLVTLGNHSTVTYHEL